jgi:hypothetical protein
MQYKSGIVYLFAVLTLILIVYQTKNNKTYQLVKTNKEYVRDFQRYECSDVKRIGGRPQYIRATNDSLYRIDGAWFTCFDGSLNLKQDNCLVYSFGINNDDSFDRAINKDFGCEIHSFDPFIEYEFFINIRNKSKLGSAYKIPVNDKWTFYRLGIAGYESVKDMAEFKISSMATFDQILELTNSKNKIIDIFKMDIEGNEDKVLETLDVDYLCKYVKQFMLETHLNIKDTGFELLIKFEKCFYMFRRDTRFYKDYSLQGTGFATEFQNTNGYLLQIKEFKNELILARFMFTIGELYFVNLNFL